MQKSSVNLIGLFSGSINTALLYPIFGVIVLINILVVIWEIGYLNKINYLAMEERKKNIITDIQIVVNAFPENHPENLNRILRNLAVNPIIDTITLYNRHGIAIATSNPLLLNTRFTHHIPATLIPTIQEHYFHADSSPSYIPTSRLPERNSLFREVMGHYVHSTHADVATDASVNADTAAPTNNPGLVYVYFNEEYTQVNDNLFLKYEILFLLCKLLLVGLMVYTILQRQITFPISTLLSACRQAVKTGRFELQETLPSNEFNQLSSTFKWVMQSLNNHQIELNQAKTKLEAIFRSVQESILTIDTSGTVQSVNSAVVPMFGYQMEELVNRPVTFLFPEYQANVANNIIKQIALNPQRINFGRAHQLEGKKRSGENFPLLLKITPGEANGESFYTIFIQDLSERVNIEQKLAENQALFQAAINSSLLGFALQKPDGTIINVNPYLPNLLGYSQDELTGTSLFSLIAESSQANTHQKWEMLQQDKIKDFSSDCLFKHRDGDDVWGILSSTKVRSPLRGEHVMVTQLVDITNEKTLMMRLAQRNKELQRSNDDLYNFAHCASHDLKSPLNAIGNIVGWIEDDCGETLPQASKEHLTILKNRCDRMKKLLDDLLGYSRLGKLDFSEQNINLGIMAKGIFELQEHANTFHFSADDVTLRLPRVPIEMILRNLISNAIRHHNQGQGHIEVRCQTLKEYYHISVFDDGPGIPSELHEKAMEMFQTLRSRDEVEGSGIGLAMINKLLAHFHGRLEIHPNHHQGTEMRVVWLKNWKEFSANQD